MADKHSQDEHDVPLPDLEQPGAHHEASDINIWAVAKFGIGLALVCVMTLAFLTGVFKFFLSREGGPVPNQNLNVDARRLPPEPRLQQSPILDLQEMRAAEDKLLDSYGWVDQGHGVVRVPVGRAMDLLAQRGLPSRPQKRAAKRLRRR